MAIGFYSYCRRRSERNEKVVGFSFPPWETKLKEIDQQRNTTWRSRSAVMKGELSSVTVSYTLKRREKALWLCK